MGSIYFCSLLPIPPELPGEMQSVTLGIFESRTESPVVSIELSHLTHCGGAGVRLVPVRMDRLLRVLLIEANGNSNTCCDKDCAEECASRDILIMYVGAEAV